MTDRNAIKAMWQQEYDEASLAAAEMERKGDYFRAVSLWKVAQEKSLNLTQKDWCKHRAKYCENWAGKKEKDND